MALGGRSRGVDGGGGGGVVCVCVGGGGGHSILAEVIHPLC